MMPWLYKRNSSKGMTLLEAILALSIFAFMFIFVVQSFKQSHRQVRKIKEDIQWTSSLSNVLDLMRRDFQGVAYLVDFNENLDVEFPMEQEEEKVVSTETQETIENKEKKTGKLFLSPYFVFEGEDDEMEFVSHSFVQSALEHFAAQWVKVRYFVKDCKGLKKSGPGSCLLRGSNRYWNPREKTEPEETLVLLRGFDSFGFSYSGTEDFLEQTWRDQWKVENVMKLENSPLDYPLEKPFPTVVKMEIKKGKRSQVFYFPVSSSYLKAWNPYDKAYSGFPQWTAPKKK